MALNYSELSGSLVVTGSVTASLGFSGSFSGSFDIDEATLNHDDLSGFVANEHIDHSGVSITGINGLTGGGNITTSRTITLDGTSAYFTASVESVLASHTGSFASTTSVQNIIDVTGSFATTSSVQNILDVTGSFATTSSIGTFATTSSVQNILDVTGSFATTSSVQNLTDISGSFATTGSNIFSGSQEITGSLTVSGSTELSGSLFVTGSSYLSGSLFVSGAFSGSSIYVGGGITAGDDITSFYSSDENLKDNIELIPNAVEKVKQIKGVSFIWNDMSNHSGHDVGVIAQDIEKVLPELVVTRENGFKAVKYDKLVALLIQVNKELIERIEKLESK